MKPLLRAYTYSELPKGDVFRYLVLEPGLRDEALVCTLHTVLIAEAKFDAISYVWGAHERDHEITCDGHQMLVTHNLDAALRTIRHPTQALKLWADGICINQDDIDDKNHQVGRMGKIYQAAQKVLLYIGPDTDDEGSTLGPLLDDVDVMIEDAFAKGTVSCDSIPYPEHEDDPILDEERWWSLYWLLREDWFGRGWVVQEAAVAREAKVIWGERIFSWDKVMKTYIWLSIRAMDMHSSIGFNQLDTNTHTMIYLRAHEEFGRAFCGDYMYSQTILEVLNCAKELDLNDPRDRIYAFSGLPQLQFAIKPRYDRPCLEVYKEFATYHVQSSKTIEILDFVTHDDRSIKEKLSWVPRWNIYAWSLAYASSAVEPLLSRSGSRSEGSVHNDCLSVQGVIVDIVQYASDEFDSTTTTQTAIKGIWDRIQQLKIANPYDSPDHDSKRQFDVFIQALTAGLTSGEDTEWIESRDRFAAELQSSSNASLSDESSPVVQLPLRAVSSQVHSMRCGNDQNFDKVDRHAEAEDDTEDDGSDGDGSEIYEPNLYFRTVKRRAHGNKFVVTGRGYMGLVPSISREEDAVAIIFGCLTPSILRSVETDAKYPQANCQRYKYVGSSPLLGKCGLDQGGDVEKFSCMLGDELSKDWVDWDIDEQEIILC